MNPHLYSGFASPKACLLVQSSEAHGHVSADVQSVPNNIFEQHLFTTGLPEHILLVLSGFCGYRGLWYN